MSTGTSSIFKIRRGTTSTSTPNIPIGGFGSTNADDDDLNSRDRTGSSLRERFTNATFFAAFTKAKPADNSDALSTQSSSFSFSFLGQNSASPKREGDSDEANADNPRSRSSSSSLDDMGTIGSLKGKPFGSPSVQKEENDNEILDIPNISDLDISTGADLDGFEVDSEGFSEGTAARDPRDNGIYFDKILRFLLLSMKLQPADVATTLENVQGLRKNTLALLDENQIEFLEQVQNEVQNMFEHQVKCKGIYTIQRYAKRKVDRRRYQMMKSSGMIPRQMAILDLLNAEKAYVEILKYCYKTFYIPLSQQASAVGSSRDPNFPDPHELKGIFGNYEALFHYHFEFLRNLDDLTEGWPYAAENIGSVLKKSVNAMKIYEEYANNFQHSRDVLSRFDENAKFASFIQGFENQNPGDLPFQACLSQPLDRTSLYERVIETILLHTPKQHQDYAELSQAYDSMRRLTFSIQSKLEKSGSRAQVLDILRRMQDGHDKFSLDSIFVQEGDLIACHESKLNQRHIFLFDDRLILARSASKTMFRFRNMYKISQMKIRDLPDQGNLRYIFEIVLPSESFILSASTADEKRKWVEGISSVLSERAANTVFGSPLEALLKKEHHQYAVPRFFHDAAEHILSQGIEIEGIFRVPGNSSSVEKLKETLDAGRDYDFLDQDPIDVAAIMKMWLRDLPEPLIPYAMYDDIIAAQENDDPSVKLCEFKNIIIKLPNSHQKALQFLCSFLTKVSQFHSKNKMNTKNLATVFGPNVIRPRVDTILTSSQIPQTNDALLFIIEKYRTLF